MKTKLVPSLVNLRRAIARILDCLSGKAARQDSQSCGTSPIGDSATTGALCPDVKGGTVRKLRFPATFRTFLSAFRFPISAFLLGGLTASSLFAQRGPQDTWYLEREIDPPQMPGLNRPFGVTVAPNGEIYVAEADNHRISVWDGAGNYLRAWGHQGTGDGEFNVPHEIVIAGDEAFVADKDNHRIQVFDLNGTFLRKWGSSGTSEGKFNRPWGLAVDVIGDNTEIYVSEHSNHRVQVFDANGTFLRKWGSYGTGDNKFNNPLGITIGSDNLVYVASYHHTQIKVFQKDGTFVRSFSAIDKPHDICVLGNRIAVGHGDNYAVRIFENNGTEVTYIGGYGTDDGKFNKPYFVASDGAGNLLVGDSDNDRVQKFNAAGAFLSKFGFLAKAAFTPQDLLVKPNGNLLFSESNGDRIIEMDENGTLIRQFGGEGTGDGQLKDPYQMAFAHNGNLVVADQYNYRISIFAPDGQFVKKFGSNGTDDGQFNKPMGVTVSDEGEIFVSDTYNHRIQVFDSNGTFLRKWGSGNGSLEGQLSHPKWLQFSEEGELYVGSSNRVDVFDKQGTFIRRVTSNGTRMRFSTDGLLMDDSGGLRVRETDGSVVKQFGAGSGNHPAHSHPRGGYYLFHDSNTIRWYRNTYRNIRPKPSNDVPMPEVISVSQREGTNYVDVSFRIHDTDSATVETGLLAFMDGGTDLSKVIVPETFVGDVTGKLGENVATGQVHTITWNAGADWNVGFGELEMEVLAKDDRDLLNYHLLTLPPTDNNNTELVISRSPITEADLLDIWYWIVASGSTEVNFRDGTIGVPADPAGEGFSPASVGGVKMWLDATDVDGDGQADSLANGADVTTWADKAGGDHNASGGNPPTYAAAGLNGHPSVHFDGSADYLAFLEITDIRTVFWVMSKDADAGNGRTLLGGSSTSDFETAGGANLWNSTYASHYVRYGSAYLGGYEIDGRYTPVPTGSFLLSLVTTGNVSANQLTKDRTWGRYWKGEIAEILIYNAALGDEDRKNVQQYLAEKWDVAHFNETYAQGSTTTASGKAYLLGLLGLREATSTEVTRAKHAGTPGIINQFTPTFKVGPDERPVKVNEYGFDVGATGGFWVVPVEEEGSN